MNRASKCGLAAGLVVLGLTATATAAPVEVDLRIEGATATHFEGHVSTDARSTLLGSDQQQHPCDGTNKGAPAPTPTAGAALATAAETAPFSYSLSWFGSGTDDFFLDSVAGETPDIRTSFWGLWLDGEPASTGMCGALLHEGEEIVWSVSTSGTERLLKLTGPPTGAQRGDTVTLTATDRGTGDSVPGALVGNTQTGPDGKVTIPLTQTGVTTFKATKAGMIRSNAVSVVVSERGAPVAATPGDRIAPLARLLGIADRHRFAKGKGPRTLRAKVTDASGLAAVKLRLTRRVGKRCFYFSGRRTALERTRCGRSFFFKVGESTDVSYLLPERLGPGRYVLDLAAVDRAGNRSALVRGSTRVVFTVR